MLVSSLLPYTMKQTAFHRFYVSAEVVALQAMERRMYLRQSSLLMAQALPAWLSRIDILFQP